MELRSERIIMKEMTWDDVDLIHQLHCQEDVERYNTIGIPRHKGDTLAVMLAAIEDRVMPLRMHFGWTLWTLENDEFIGEAGMDLSAPRFKKAEIYYSLAPAYWHYGYATEVVKRMVQFGFNTLQLHRIQAGVATENERSIRVLQKVGMTCEGRRRKVLPIRGEWKDIFQYAVLEEDVAAQVTQKGEQIMNS